MDHSCLIVIFLEVFHNELGQLQCIKTKPLVAKDQISEDPFLTLMKSKVDKELRKLEAEGIIDIVKISNWITLEVLILKPDNSISLYLLPLTV